MRRITALTVGALMSVLCLTACGGKGKSKVTESDYYTITVACQTEMGEEEVLRVLKKRYEELHQDRRIDIKTFSGEGFEQYMLGIAAEQSSSPNIIWTADTYHSQWEQYFVDLRPYYEASAETDYSLYYETMLDAASTHGYFKPTKNYTNPLGAFNRELDENSDGMENYKNQSEYGLYYAPRDYNKPAILCNTHLFDELDSDYETVYKSVTGATEMPADYQSTRARLAEIVAGTDWDELNDLTAFAKFIAKRMIYITNNATTDRTMGRKWGQRAVLNLFLEWEPTYTTVLNDVGVDIIKDDGSLELAAYEETFEALHAEMFPDATDEDKQIAGVMMTTNGGSIQFSSGNLFMSVCSRPVVLGYRNTFYGTYGEACLESIRLPVKDIAAGNSGYAISNIWEEHGVSVNGEYKSYTELSWDFIKFIISEEGQEVAGETGLNIPVLKKLYSAETNGGVEPAWRKVESLGEMNHDAWVAGGELRQDTYNIFKAEKRNAIRSVTRVFFANLQRKNYNDGSLANLIKETVRSYNLQSPTSNLR